MKDSTSLTKDCLVLLSIAVLLSLGLGLLLFGTPAGQTLEFLLVGSIAAGIAICVMRFLAFRSKLQAVNLVETQLATLSTAQAPVDSLLPVISGERFGRGWNRIVGVLKERELDDAIDRRLQQSSGGQRAEKLARALRSLNEGLAITDSESKITFANTALASMLDPESDCEDLIDTSVIHLLSGAGYWNWADCHKSLIGGSKPISVNLNLGNSVHEGVHQVSRLPLAGRTGESPGFVWLVRDVTQSSIARESHEQFLASATHELRTPLTNIRAYTESLLTIDDVTPEQQKEFYNVIYSEARRLGRLLNELLDIQQLEAGSMTIQSKQFEIQRMVQEVQEYLSPLISEKGLTFHCRIPPDLKTIEADKEKITSCLINLLGNAVKYTPDGGEIRLLAERLENSIELTVVDTGFGIAEEELPHVFERFYRCQDERVGEIEGNGLGLAFCFEVARLHGGDMLVESKLNEGSRFTLRLPLKNME